MSNLSAAQLRFSHLGLQQGGIDALTQDNYGFIWIGTKNGLVRYDGNTVTSYQNTSAIPTTLQGNTVIALHYGKDERLWIGTDSAGASYYDYSKAQFKRIETNVIGSKIYRFFDNFSGEGIFVQTELGLFKIDKKNKIKLILSPKYSESILGIHSNQSGVHAILENGNKITLGSNPLTPSQHNLFPRVLSQYWSLNFCQHLVREPIEEAGGNGLFHCIKDDKPISLKLNKILIDAGIDIEHLIIYDLVEDDDEIIWMTSDRGLIRVAGDLVTITKSLGFDGQSLSSNKLSVLLAGQKNTLFVGTQDQGLNILNSDTSGISFLSNLDEKNKTTPFTQKDKPCPKASEESRDAIWSILKDTEGDLWVGNNSGLSFMPSESVSFQDYSRLSNDAQPINICSVWSLAEADKLIWIGTKQGLVAYNKHDRTFVLYQSQGETDQHFKLSGNFIRALQYDKKRESLWIGTDQHGLNRIDLKSRKIQRFPYNNDPTALPHAQIHSLYLDSDNNLWVGTSNGLSLWDDGSNTFRTIHATDSPNSLSDSQVYSIYQTDQDHLWLGTGNGLNLFNINQFSVVKRLFERDGLVNSTIYNILPDNQGLYWISTANGLSHFDPTKVNFDNYYPQYDAQSSGFSFHSWHKSKKILLYLGGSNGLNIINPHKLSTDEQLYSPLLTSIYGFDTQNRLTNLTGILPAESSQVVKTSLRDIQLNYIHPFFGDGDLVKSQYRLLPEMETWSEAKPGSHYADYTDLESGHYNFQLRTNLTDNQISNFRFYIEPYFWETLWFKVLVFAMMLVSTIFLSIYFYRLWSKFSAEKLARQHYHIVEHELRPHLSEVSKHLHSLLQSSHLASKDKQLVSSSIIPLVTRSTNFIAELRTLVDLRRAVKQPRQLYLLEDVLDEVLLFFKDQHERIIIGDIEDINIKTHQDAVYLLVKNLISNALKYSPNGEKINLNVFQDQKALRIECIDQGIGISKDKREAIYEPYKRFVDEHNSINGQGIGLAIVRFIVHTYQGSIHIEDNHPKGSRFIVVLKGVVTDDK